jgi:lysophospholipase L1-like esterase
VIPHSGGVTASARSTERSAAPERRGADDAGDEGDRDGLAPAQATIPVLRLARRPARVAATVAGLLLLALTAIVLTLAVWPTDRVEVLGVRIEVGAQRPGPDFGLSGPGRLESFGQTVELRAVEVVGPVRPFLGTAIAPYDLIRIATTPGAPDEGGEVLVDAFIRWAALRTPVVLGTGLLLLVASVAILSFIGALPPLHRHSWRRYTSWAVTASIVTGVAWGASLAAAAYGSQRLAEVESLDEVFDYDVLRTSPAPVGDSREGYDIVVVGDSRAAVYGGGRVPGATRDDVACARSRDSLAEQVESLLVNLDWRAANLACLSATVEDGLLQPQLIGAEQVPAQVGVLKSIVDPEVVVVSVGPNDVFWGPIVGSCYVTTCNVSFLSPTVNALMSDFRRSYQDLLADLAELEASPQVIVVGAYAPFAPGLTCADTELPDGTGGLTDDEIDTVLVWRDRLNEIMSDGAEEFGFSYVEPPLRPLCEPDSTGLGPDIWPLESEFRFHPTSIGVLKTATVVVEAIDPERFEDQAAEDEAAREAEEAGRAVTESPSGGPAEGGEAAQPGR